MCPFIASRECIVRSRAFFHALWLSLSMYAMRLIPSLFSRYHLYEKEAQISRKMPNKSLRSRKTIQHLNLHLNPSSSYFNKKVSIKKLRKIYYYFFLLRFFFIDEETTYCTKRKFMQTKLLNYKSSKKSKILQNRNEL